MTVLRMIKGTLVGKIKEVMKILRKSPERTKLEHCIYFRHAVAELSLFCVKTENN